MKRILSLCIAVTLCLIALPQVEPKAASNVTEIVFGAVNRSVGIHTEGEGMAGNYAGREALVLDPNFGQKELKIWFEGELENLNDGSCVTLSVSYYDQGYGKFMLYYDGHTGQMEHPEIVRMQNTNVWKTKLFTLQNPRFGGGVSGGCDAKLALSKAGWFNSDEKVIISNIRAEKTDYRSVYKVEIVQDHTGNIHFSDEELSIPVRLSMLAGLSTESEKAEAIYKVLDEDGETVWSRTEDVDLSRTYTTELKPEQLKYGIYRLQAIVENAELHYKTVSEIEFSYVLAAKCNDDWGVNTHFFGNRWPWLDEMGPLMKKAGIGFIRDSVNWHDMEKTKGTFALTAYDQQVLKSLRDLDMKILWLDAYGNPLYVDDPRVFYMPDTDEAIAGFARYAGKAAELGVDYTEIWNEPNTGFNIANIGYDVYTKLTAASYKQIKEVNPDAVVTGLSLVCIPDVHYGILDEVFGYGLGDVMDALAIHPYIWTTSPLAHDFENKMQRLDEYFLEKGYPDMKFWITEMGWATGPAQQWSQEQQAAYLVQTNLICQSIRSFDKFAWYCFMNKSNNEAVMDDNYGLIEYKGSNKSLHARKSLLAAAAMNDLMADSEFLDKAVENDNYLYRYRNGSGEFTAVFSKKPSSTIGLATKQESVQVMDLYGNVSTLYAVDGVVNIQVGEEPQYILGSGLNLKFAQPTVYPSANRVDVIIGEETAVNITAPQGAETVWQAFGEGLNCKTGENSSTALLSSNVMKETTDILHVNVKNGEKLLLDGDIQIGYADVISASLSNRPYSIQNFNRWMGELTVTNNSKVQSISGMVLLERPELFAQKLRPVKIPKLLPGETKTISFHFPEILIKEAYDVGAEISLNNGYHKTFSARIDFGVAVAAGDIAVDGVMSPGEWTQGAALAFNREEQAVSLDSFYWGGVEDLSGKACVSYDQDYFYLGTQVTDDVFYCETTEEKDFWRYDSIQFGVAYNRANGDAGSQLFTEIGVALTPDGPKMWTAAAEEISIGLGETDLQSMGGEMVFKRDGNVTTYEMKIPWSALIPRSSVIASGKNLAFSMLVNDNDGAGRKGWLEYASGIGKTKSVTLYTYLRFM